MASEMIPAAAEHAGSRANAAAAVKIPTVSAPKHEIKTAEQALELSLKWEQEATNQMPGILELALKESDYTTQQFLQWFVEEQWEEVSSMEKLLAVVRRVGEDGLLFVEDYLARERNEEKS